MSGHEVYFSDMQNEPLTRHLVERIRTSGISLELLAFSTGKSHASVDKYLKGTRNPSPEWIAKCEAVLTAYETRRAA